MFNNTLLADVWFSVGSEALQAQLTPAGGSGDLTANSATAMPKKIPAHKYVLATASTVFYAMFYGGCAGDREKDLIEVPDVEPQVPKNFLLAYMQAEIETKLISGISGHAEVHLLRRN